MIGIGLNGLVDTFKAGFAMVAGWLNRVGSEPYRAMGPPSMSGVDPAAAPEVDHASARVSLVEERLLSHTSSFNSSLLEAGTITLSLLPLAKGLQTLAEIVGKAAWRGGRV